MAGGLRGVVEHLRRAATQAAPADAELLSRYAASKDEDAFALVVSRHAGTVESRLARARERLRAALARRGFAPPQARPGGGDTWGACPVAPGLARSAAGAAILFAGGKAAAGASAAAALAWGGLGGGMAMGKFMGVAAVLAAAGLLGAATAWVGGEPWGGPGVAAAPAPPARKPARPRADSELLLGEWRVVKGEAGGKHLPDEVAAGQVWSFSPRGLSVALPGGDGRRATWRIDPSAAPKAIDLAFQEPPWRGAAFQGIYELQGGQLRIKYFKGAARPAWAPAREREERGTVTLVLERVPGPK